MRPVQLIATAAVAITPLAPAAVAQQGQDKATRVADSIYAVFGGSNAYLVTTPQGNVVIDTCNPIDAPECLRILKAVSAAPITRND